MEKMVYVIRDDGKLVISLVFEFWKSGASLTHGRATNQQNSTRESYFKVAIWNAEQLFRSEMSK